ncbi:hypothetical protein HYPSUDRAFT_202425 [Hypholoma sublateritium FD-334 SS-4]|uniref:Uncharacterized protein n=1 Tax=Hypholoma sublateritium (strain FD-334 SS-4) TaxID=945553 RepID=A0A0D2P0F8_HYPSF|nr:hypothetical protein HYPSUDRAFT_202425 [Hypholoma sublateritium FD-334 SS-4]
MYDANRGARVLIGIHAPLTRAPPCNQGAAPRHAPLHARTLPAPRLVQRVALFTHHAPDATAVPGHTYSKRCYDAAKPLLYGRNNRLQQENECPYEAAKPAVHVTATEMNSDAATGPARAPQRRESASSPAPISGGNHTLAPYLTLPSPTTRHPRGEPLARLGRATSA